MNVIGTINRITTDDDLENSETNAKRIQLVHFSFILFTLWSPDTCRFLCLVHIG